MIGAPIYAGGMDRFPEEQAVHGDLTAHLMPLNSLSPWPVGQSIKKVLVFGLLPPASWAMAALVEHLLF